MTRPSRPTRPKRRLRGSVRWRITLAVTVVFGVTLALAGFLFVNRVEASLVEKIKEADRAELERVSGYFQNGDTLPDVLPPLPNRPNAQVQALGPNGDVVAATAGLQGRGPIVNPPRPANLPPPLPPANQANQANPPAQGVGAPPRGVNPRPPLGPDGRPIPGAGPPASVPASSVPPTTAPPGAALAATASTIPPNAAGQPRDYAVTQLPVATKVGEVDLVALSPLTEVKSSVDALATFLWFAIPILVVFIGATAWVLTGRALRPVAAMTKQVEEISASTLHERVEVPASDDEIAHLARTMNGMLERLEQSSGRQKQFVSDASHELRSPVASIRTELEVALMHPELADWDEVSRNVLAEDERLERIVTDLLTLARLDEQATIDNAADVDFDLVVQGELERTRRLPVVATAMAAARVRGRPEELARMVGHLLDNAARHGESRVEAGVDASSAGRVRFYVDDDGPGVPPDRRAAVFERFGRLQEGRSRDSGGAGLGLAVVKRIAERHGGTVTVGTSPIGGARFSVLLPDGSEGVKVLVNDTEAADEHAASPGP